VKPKTNVDCVSNAASGEYQQGLQKEESEDDKFKQRSFDSGMHTDDVSMSLHFDVVESGDEEEQSKSRHTDINYH
jgi:GTP cyclohydrolase III